MRKLWKHPHLTDNQSTLFGKTIGQKQTEKELQQRIDELKQELKNLEHYRSCEQCRWEMVLSVERYLGSRGPWYINLQYDCIEDEDDDPTRPDPGKFKVGKTHKHTLRFLTARMNWAENIMTTELKAAEEQFQTVENRRAF